MADARTALSRDAFATTENPAGLVVASSNMAALSHRKWVGNLRSYDVATRFGIGERGAVGLAVTATDSGELEARDRPGEPSGTFSAQFISLGASYARSVGPLRVGATAKYLRERIYGSDASGYAIDAGVQLDLAGESVVIGAVLQNVGKMSTLEREATELPRTLRAGAALYPFQVLANADGTRLLEIMVTGEVSHLIPSDLTRLHAGLAATVMELVVLRSGYVTQDELRDLTFGLGLSFDTFTFNYAYVPFEEGFEGPGHLLTLLYAW